MRSAPAARLRRASIAALSALLAALLVVLVALEIVNVVLRYVVGAGFVWSVDVAILLTSSLAWIGVPTLWLARGHIAVDLATGLLGRRYEAGLRVALDLGAIAAGLALAIHGHATLQAFGMITLPALGLPGSVKYVPIVAGAGLLVYAGALNLLADRAPETDLARPGAAP